VHVKHCDQGVGCEYPFTFDQVYEGVKHLSKEQHQFLKGRALTTRPRDRSRFQHAFIAIFKVIEDLRVIKSRPNPLMFNAFDPPMNIVPLTQLVNLRTQKGTRLKEVNMTTQSYDLADLLSKPLLSKYGVVILGKPTTTGFGKTQFALRVAVEWCKAQHTGKGVRKEDCSVVFSNTIDVAREIVFKSSYCWVIDEFCPGDHAQAIHMSENMMKILLSPKRSWQRAGKEPGPCIACRSCSHYHGQRGEPRGVVRLPSQVDGAIPKEEHCLPHHHALMRRGLAGGWCG